MMKKMTNQKNELIRKFSHFFLILAPILYYHLGKWESLQIFAIITAVIVTLDYLRCNNERFKNILNKIFLPILREHEIKENKLSGASFAALGACVTFVLFKAEIAITAFMILVFSDSAAAIISQKFPSRPFFEKSLSGAIAFSSVGLMVLFSCGYFFDVNIWFYFFAIFSLACTTIIESRPSFLRIDDNFTIPVSFAVIMTVFDLIWNFV